MADTTLENQCWACKHWAGHDPFRWVSTCKLVNESRVWDRTCDQFDLMDVLKERDGGVDKTVGVE